MPLQIIGAGYSRTGTKSLQQALHHLGFPCYHMTELILHPSHVDFWAQVHAVDQPQPQQATTHNQQQTTPPQVHSSNTIPNSHHLNISSPPNPVSDALLHFPWDNFFVRNGYTAAVDYPVVAYYQELARVYPNAKIILTVRDSDEVWYRSIKHTVFEMSDSWLVRMAFLFDPVSWKRFHLNRKILYQGPRSMTKNRKLDDKHAIMASYRQHVQQVIDTFKDTPHRLLIFNVKQGWAPLAEFLNRPIPKDVPFPNVNEKLHFQRMIAQRKRKGLINLVIILSAALLSAALLSVALITSLLGGGGR